jgi:hypothetical protein
MPIEAQPPGRRGTVGQPYSALNLRLGLALFGVVFCALAAAGILMWTPLDVLGWILVGLAVVAAVDAVVVQARRRARKRAGDTGHSIFE